MAKGKRGKGRNYTSQGLRPSVSKKIRNDVRRHRIQTVDSMMKSAEMMSSARKDIISRAEALYAEFKDKVTWASCVQAVKTDYVASFRNKYFERGTAQKKKQKSKSV